MKDMKRMVLAGMMFLVGTLTLNATENADGKEAVDTTYIKLDENREPINHVNLTKEELEEQKAVKIKMLSAILDKLAVPACPSPAKARNYAMASKPVGVRLAWVCNYKHAMHSSPCGCAKPQMGGKWVVLGKNSNAEIKDDK